MKQPQSSNPVKSTTANSTGGTKPKANWRTQVAEKLLAFCLGIVYAYLNFPRLLQTLAERHILDRESRDFCVTFFQQPQLWMSSITGPRALPEFVVLMTCCFSGVAIYVVLLGAFSLRQGRPKLLLAGLLGLFAGFIGFQAIAWVALIVFAILRIAYAILLALGNIASHVAFFFTSGPGRWPLLAIVAVGWAYALYDQWKKYLIQFLSLVGLTCLLHYLVPAIGRLMHGILVFIESILTQFVLPIVAFLISWLIMVTIVAGAVCAVVAVVSSFGQLVIDQFRAAWNAGRGTKGVVNGAFSIGTALSLILLTSVANPKLVEGVQHGWNRSLACLDTEIGTHFSAGEIGSFSPAEAFAILLPESVHHFTFSYFVSASAPLYDAAVLLLILIVTCAGILRYSWQRLAHTANDVAFTLVPDDYFALVYGLVFSVAFLYAQMFAAVRLGPKTASAG